MLIPSSPQGWESLSEACCYNICFHLHSLRMKYKKVNSSPIYQIICLLGFGKDRTGYHPNGLSKPWLHQGTYLFSLHSAQICFFSDLKESN